MFALNLFLYHLLISAPVNSIFSKLKHILQGMRVSFTQSSKGLGKFGWNNSRRQAYNQRSMRRTKLNVNALKQLCNLMKLLLHMKLKFRNRGHDFTHWFQLQMAKKHYDWKLCSEQVKNVDLVYWLDKHLLRIISVILVLKYSWKNRNCFETEFNSFKLIQWPNCRYCEQVVESTFTVCWKFQLIKYCTGPCGCFFFMYISAN